MQRVPWLRAACRYNNSRKRFEGLSELCLHPIVEQMHQVANASDLDLLSSKIAKGWFEMVVIATSVSRFNFGVCHLATNTIT